MNRQAERNIKRQKKISIKKNLSGWLLILPTVFLFVFLVWRPIIIGIGYSFFQLKGFKPVEFVGLDNYIKVLSDTNFLRTLGNTVQYVVWSLIIGLPLPYITAVFLNEVLRGKQFFKVAMYLPGILPSMATYLLWTYVYGEGSTGILNSLLYYVGLDPVAWLADGNKAIVLIIIMMSWSGFGGTMVMYLASLQSVDNALFEAARLDGANLWQRFKTITFTQTRGIILLLAIRQIIGIFGITEQVMVMTGGGPNGATMSLGLTNYYYAFKYGAMEKSLALGVISFLLLIGLTIVYFGLDRKINE